MNKLPKIGNETTLTQKAYDAIKEAILDNRLKPGQRLKEEDLAESLSISRTPIRSAIKRLSYDHLVTIESSRNVYVTKLTKKDIKELRVVREMLEQTTIKLLVEKIDDNQINILNTILNDQQKSYKEDNYEEYIKYEGEFHMSLVKFTENKWLIDIAEKIYTISKRYLILSGSLKRHSAIAIEEHRKVLSALRKKNLEKAKKHMVNHVRRAMGRIFE